jgi:hypothetical protein
MLLFQFLFSILIIKLEYGLLNELKTMKEEAMVAKKEEARKKEEAGKKEEEAKKSKETTKDIVARWWLGLLQGCSSWGCRPEALHQRPP